MERTPEYVNTRTLPSCLFYARLYVEDRLSSRRPDVNLVTPILITDLTI